MGSNSMWPILLTVAVVGLVILLLAEAPSPAQEALSVEPTVQKVAVRDVVAAQRTAPLIVDAGSNLTLDERESVRLRGALGSTGNGAVSYHWIAAGGRGYFNSAYLQDPVYTAPSICGCEECVLLTLVVTDASGMSASDQIYVRVRGDALACLSSNAAVGCGQTASPCPPCQSTPCQEPPKVDRCQPQPLPCESPCIRHIFPEPACSRTPVPCCDSPCGWSFGFPWTIDDTSVPAADHPSPLIDRHYPTSIDEGGTARIIGKVNNPACTSVCFQWTASKGWFEDENTLTPVYHAPSSDRLGGEQVTITLTIHDGFGGRSFDQIRMYISNLDYRGASSASTSNNWLLGTH